MWILLVGLLVVLWICLDDSIIIDIHKIQSNKVSDKVKLAVVSDFHCGNAKEVLHYLNQIELDAVLIPGDLIYEKAPLDSVQELLGGLKKWPCFYVSGNHEYKKGTTYSDYSWIQKVLSENGVVCLENESRVVSLNSQKIWIGGVQDHTSDKTKDPEELDQKHIDDVCACLGSDFSILLMHRPEQYRMIEKYPVDVVVSGHAHGGQWRFPGLNGVFAPQQGLFPKRAGGLYQMKHGVHLVSRGLAHYWFLPRILNHREINIIEIERAD